MSRRKPMDRCLACHMRQEICLCPDIRNCKESLKTKTRVVIIMHARERFLTTNTARIANLLILDCEIRMRGFPAMPLKQEGILEATRQPFLLYPSEDAVELTPDFIQKFSLPFTLIVPDGSWRQASKVSKREDFLKNVMRVKLPAGLPSTYKLRKETKPEGLATFEAIARALGIIEGEKTEASLLSIFNLMTERTLASRGVRS